MNKAGWIILIIVIILAGGWWWYSENKGVDAMTQEEEVMTKEEGAAGTVEEGAPLQEDVDAMVQ